MKNSLLENIVGADFNIMPIAVKNLHNQSADFIVNGTSRVMGGTNIIAWFIRIMAQLPKPAHRAPITINFRIHPNSEEWDRNFGGSRFHTLMTQENDRLVETLVKFPVSYIYNVIPGPKGFSLKVSGLRFLGLPLPRFLWPSLEARASEWRGRYRFSTVVSFWFCGRVISYFGYLDKPRSA